MSEKARPRVKAALELAEERSQVEVSNSPDGQRLSEMLVELKGLCMERLALLLLRDNATAGEDPLLQDPLDASDNEDDDNPDSLAEDNSRPPRPKKRK